MNTCTIRTSEGTCGRPAVTTFTTRRGETFHECAEHDASAAMPTRADHGTAAAPHPPTRTSRAFVLVAGGRIRGYADRPESAANVRRAERSGGRWVRVQR